jgi:hypothetical protein
MLEFLIVALAVWRVTSLLVNEDGPFDIFEKVRFFVGVRWDEHSEKYGKNVLGEAFTCVWCLSVWTSAIGAVFIAPSLAWYPCYVLALSSISILIEELVNG